MDNDVAAQMRANAGNEGSTSKLRKGMMPAAIRHDVVSRLRATIEAHHQLDVVPSHQRIGEQPLAGVTKAQIHNNKGPPIPFSAHPNRRFQSDGRDVALEYTCVAMPPSFARLAA